MSDERLRELERRWRETRAADDEAAYLAERVRVGDLTSERLSLAAYVGHPAAAKAIGDGPSDTLLDPIELVEGLERWGRAVTVRACVAAATSILRWWERDHPTDGSVARTLEAVRAWTDCPCSSHADAARGEAGEIPTYAENAGRWSERAAEAAWGAVRAIAWEPPPQEIDQAPGLADAVVFAQEVVGDDEALRQHIMRAIAEWALGPSHLPATPAESDPG